jgi:catechol 2,3-dioxygenase
MTNLPQQPENGPQLLSHESRLGSVHIAVTDPTQAQTFWTQVIGLTKLEPSDAPNTIRLGAGNQELVVLHPNATGGVEPRRTGLYHLAIHLPNAKEFARAIARLFSMGYPNSPTDHTMTEATYLSDPDGNGIELTLETPERGQTVWLPNGQPTMQTRSGRLVSPVEHLDVRPLLELLDPTDDLRQAMPAGTKIGHVHLHVRDVRKAASFYRDLIGFRVLMEIPQMGMIDFGLEVNSMPHTLALNAWHGPHAALPTPGTAGLRFFTVRVPKSDLAALEARLRTANWAFEPISDGLQVLDPSGNALQVVADGITA